VTLLSAKSEGWLTDKEMASWAERRDRTVAQTVRDDARGIQGEQRGGLWESVEKAVCLQGYGYLVGSVDASGAGSWRLRICQELRGNECDHPSHHSYMAVHERTTNHLHELSCLFLNSVCGQSYLGSAVKEIPRHG
jgi:hypothetical protein